MSEKYELESIPSVSEIEFNYGVDLFRAKGHRVKVVMEGSLSSYSPETWIALARKISTVTKSKFIMLVMEKGNEAK